MGCAEGCEASGAGAVAAYKYPRRIWFVDEWPNGPTPRILGREIKVPEPAKAR